MPYDNTPENLSRRDAIFNRVLQNVRVNHKTQCWEWQGVTTGTGRGGGYGRMSINSTTVLVHRVVYTHCYGIIPHKKQIDHKCRNRLCCNPEHLELVTHKQNQKRKQLTKN